MKNSSKAVLLASVAVLSWSTVATAFKIALRNMSVYEMLFVACATALTVFTIWLTVSRRWGELRNLTRQYWIRYALLGIVMPVSYYLVLFSAYDYLPAQVAQPVNYIWPILLAVLLATFGHKPIERSKYFGMAVSLGGVAVISLCGGGAIGHISMLGLAMAIGSALLWAFYWIINDSMNNVVSQPVSLFLTFMFGMVYMLIGTIWSPLSEISTSGLLSGMYIGTFEMGVPFICFGLAIRKTNNPALINQMCYLAPFISLFIISMVLGETIALSTYIGLTLIVGGLLFNEIVVQRRLAKSAS